MTPRSMQPLGSGGAISRLDRSAPDSGPEHDAAHLVELLSRSSRGQEEAFAQLYDLTSRRIYGIVLRVLRAPDHAAEVTQEVYVDVWRLASQYAPERGSVLAWMTTLAHRRAVDRVRSVSSATNRDDRYAHSSYEREDDQVWVQVERQLDVERVRRSLAGLTTIQREALTLAYFGGYTQEQISRLLQVPLGTVKTRIRDGLIRLRGTLGEVT